MEESDKPLALLISSLDGVSFHFQAPVSVPGAGVQWTVAAQNGEDTNLWPLSGIKLRKPSPYAFTIPTDWPNPPAYITADVNYNRLYHTSFRHAYRSYMKLKFLS